jgi:outer membrane lipoprotein SlyB
MNAVLQKIKHLTILAVALALCGCAATQKLSDADRATFKTAKVNGTVEKGQVFLLAPSGANIGLMFGAIGGAVTGASMEDSQKAFVAFLEKNSVSIEKIVREEVEQTLRESGKLAIVSQGEASAATVNITVPQYGFGVTHLLSSNVVPVLQIKCDMVDSSGKLLWSANERMLPSVASPMEPITWAQLSNDPKQMEEQWRKASRHLAKKIIDDL